MMMTYHWRGVEELGDAFNSRGCEETVSIMPLSLNSLRGASQQESLRKVCIFVQDFYDTAVRLGSNNGQRYMGNG
jgi:hypothetical protein